MGAVTVDEALRKGKIQLFWIPLILLIGMLLGGVALIILLKENSYAITTAIVLIIGAFILPWVWWSYKVVKWKIWAFANVSDIRTLEKRAIAMQLIWPHGSWFEKTEFKTKQEKEVIEYLYNKLQVTSSKKEPVIDPSLPAEMIIRFSNFSYYGSGFTFLLGIYLIYAGNTIMGGIGIVMGVYLAYEHYRKTYHKKFLLKVDATGITLPTAQLPWTIVQHYYIKREGVGDTAQYFLVIETSSGLEEIISLSDIQPGAFTVERYLDVYRTRFEQKQVYH